VPDGPNLKTKIVLADTNPSFPPLVASPTKEIYYEQKEKSKCPK
jgi:hypothetical protein